MKKSKTTKSIVPKVYKKIKLLALCLLIMSCGASNKITRLASSRIDGKWVLDTVNYETVKKGTYTITMFNDIPFKCLENTDWNFIANNNRGNYTFHLSCNEIPQQNFIWHVPKEMYGFNHSIILKPVNEKNKSVINDKGYKMELETLKKEEMTWAYETSVQGEKLILKLHFRKL